MDGDLRRHGRAGASSGRNGRPDLAGVSLGSEEPGRDDSTADDANEAPRVATVRGGAPKLSRPTLATLRRSGLRFTQTFGTAVRVTWTLEHRGTVRARAQRAVTVGRYRDAAQPDRRHALERAFVAQRQGQRLALAEHAPARVSLSVTLVRT